MFINTWMRVIVAIQRLKLKYHNFNTKLELRIKIIFQYIRGSPGTISLYLLPSINSIDTEYWWLIRPAPCSWSLLCCCCVRPTLIITMGEIIHITLVIHCALCISHYFCCKQTFANIEVLKSRRRPRLGLSPGWKRLALSHLRLYYDTMLNWC